MPDHGTTLAVRTGTPPAAPAPRAPGPAAPPLAAPPLAAPPLAATARIACRLHGGDALVTISGTVDRYAIARVEIMIHALRTAGATRVVVDLLGVGAHDPALIGALHRQRAQQAAVGGWLLVDRAAAADDDGLDLPLAELFRIYRDATAPRLPPRRPR